MSSPVLNADPEASPPPTNLANALELMAEPVNTEGRRHNAPGSPGRPPGAPRRAAPMAARAIPADAHADGRCTQCRGCIVARSARQWTRALREPCPHCGVRGWRRRLLRPVPHGTLPTLRRQRAPGVFCTDLLTIRPSAGRPSAGRAAMPTVTVQCRTTRTATSAGDASPWVRRPPPRPRLLPNCVALGR